MSKRRAEIEKLLSLGTEIISDLVAVCGVFSERAFSYMKILFLPLLLWGRFYIVIAKSDRSTIFNHFETNQNL